MIADNDKVSFIECEDQNVFEQKLAAQSNVIKEYKSWINMLLNILNNDNKFQYYNQIKKGVEKIEPLHWSRIQLKKELFKEIKKEEEYNKEIALLEARSSELLREDCGVNLNKLVTEKLNLISSIKSLSEELDNYTYQNDVYKELESTINKKEMIANLQRGLNQIKKENQLLRGRIISKNCTKDNVSSSYAHDKKSKSFDSIGKSSKGNNSTLNLGLLSCLGNKNDQSSTLLINK